MEIKLNNIGIVKDSTISVKGLTVITGKNNSGKTTVGKAIYALLDAVSSLDAKARRDRAQYVLKRIDEVQDCFDVLRFLGHMLDEDKSKSDRHPLYKYPLLRSLLALNGMYDIPPDESEDFARKLSIELH